MRVVQPCVMNVMILEDYIVHQLDVYVSIEEILLFTNIHFLSYLGEVLNSVYNGTHCACLNSTRYANQGCGMYSNEHLIISRKILLSVS